MNGLRGMRSLGCALLLPLVACHSVVPAEGPAQDRSPPPVVAGEWRLVEQDGAALPALERVPTLRFGDGSAGGFAGCNSFRGPLAEAAPGVFAPGPHAFASTRMACPPPQSTVEDAYLAALTHAVRYRLADGQLLIEWEDGGRRGLLRFTR